MKTRWDKADLDALKQANAIEEVARDLGLTVAHHRMKCPMPGRHSHGDRTPSVTLWPERGIYKCWVCPDVKGDVIALVQLIQGVAFGEAVRWLKARAGLDGSSLSPVTSAPSKNPRPIPVWPLPDGPLPGAPTIARPMSPPTSLSSPPLGPSRTEILRKLLALAAPISGAAAKYLQSRRIFKRTWETQGLRWVDNYARISQDLVDAFGVAALQSHGLFNADAHFRYYRHVLLFPYFDMVGDPVYLQVRALQATVTPKELSLSGPIPLPYNMPLLKSAPRHVYLCEGVIDTLTLIEQGFPALGVPGAANFKPEWVPLFLDHSVHIVFDPDAAGEAGAHRVEALLGEIGIAAHRIHLPPGKDINDWLRSGGMMGRA
jgi:DNA primase